MAGSEERHTVYVLPALRLLGRVFLTDWLAITIGNRIFAWRPLDAPELAHEVEHVRQWQRYGLLLIPRYLRASWRARRNGGRGYLDNRFEVVARAAAEAAKLRATQA